jgi:hypothetical protein
VTRDFISKEKESKLHKSMNQITEENNIKKIKRKSTQTSPNSSPDPISKIPITKKGLVEWLKVKALSSSPGK